MELLNIILLLQDAKITALETQVMDFDATIMDLQNLPDTVTALDARVQTLEDAQGNHPHWKTF